MNSIILNSKINNKILSNSQILLKGLYTTLNAATASKNTEKANVSYL